MHMADALISPLVGGAMWAVTAGLTVHGARKLKETANDSVVPLMGVLGAFIFAAQMINFTIPGTGSSGHLGGGMILSILLGPYAAFLTMASVLTVQALLFADGGLLALGCNIFNLAFFPCFIAYPFIYRKIAGERPTRRRLVVGAVASSILALQMGALGVVLETLFSGISELPFSTFLFLMLSIHLAIGVVEGLVTAAVVTFVGKARPEILEMAAVPRPPARPAMNKVLAGLLVVTVVTGGALSWFASANPDGLEWSIFHTSGKEELDAAGQGPHALAAVLQEKTAFLPDYGFRPAEQAPATSGEGDAAAEAGKGKAEEWPDVSAGKSLSGLLGAAMTLLLAGLIGLGLRRSQHKR
ncbi:MAG: energy-coupling factor ABC transporter permease [Candidatus Accumulibacter sp.]|uniref:Energy-coupling factor ABC transporter permease n=1 Tax=Candidatus Accumulibacter proximus TaxID=2954385 RepID=A0A935UG70_9PROT|nr:energy-coupling factor ABC transporter permease [Candidatus Accumulibacter proximus]